MRDTTLVGGLVSTENQQHYFQKQALMKSCRTLPVIFILALGNAFAQPFVRQVECIPVSKNGSPISLPFAGGVNSPNHQFVDIDGDLDLDLFVLDTDLLVDFYRNEGTHSIPNFKLRNGVVVLPSFFYWFLFIDFDSDGLVDLATEDSTAAGVRIYRNTGTPQGPLFTPFISPLLDTSGARIFSGGGIPAFADIDNDGDLDFFGGDVSGRICFYENIGTATNPLYRFVTCAWQNILILGDTCTIETPAFLTPRHGPSAMRFADIDADKDFDLFFGDYFHQGIFFIENMGTPGNASMVCNTAWYSPNSPVVTAGFNQPVLVDIDGDTDLDLFVGVLGGITQLDGFWFLKNIGNPDSAWFRLETKNFISTIDVGEFARPAFVDIDADGDQDLFIGNLNGEITFFRNDGTPANPSYVFADSLYQSIVGNYQYAPVFVDIDNDGDADLFIGMYDGSLKFYRNTGTPQVPVFVNESSPVDTMDVGFYAAPTFIDIDADGDQDLFIGKDNGRLTFYRNSGSASTFTPMLESLFYQNITAGSNSIPTFADINGDGDFDLFIGNSVGKVEYYENIGTQTNAQFVRVTNHYANTDPAFEAAPTFVDIDADGDRELFIGVTKGGLHYYRNDLITTLEESHQVPVSAQLFQNYPNPFNPTTRIEYQTSGSEHVTLKVYDVLGREVATLVNEVKTPGTYTVVWDARGVAGGIYFYRLVADGYTQSRRMILIK